MSDEYVHDGSGGNPLGNEGLLQLVSSGNVWSGKRKIFLPNNAISSASELTVFVKSLSNGDCSMLQEVSLSQNPIGSKACFIMELLLAYCPSLTSLDFSATQVSDEGSFSFLSLGKLRRLNLTSNKIGNVGASKIAQALYAANKLQHLVLADNLIEDAGAEAIMKSLTRSTVLQSLDLSLNPIKQKSGQLLSLLSLNVSLVTVNLGLEGDELIPFYTRQNALFVEGLSDLGVTSSSFNNRKWSMVPSEVFAWKHMQSLNISDNCLTEVPFAILQLESLTSLNIANNLIGSRSLPVHLCKLPRLSKLSVRGNPFVQDLPAVKWRDCASLLDYFKECATSLDEMEVPTSVRVLVVGEEGIGKSRLIESLGKTKEKKIKDSFVRLKRLVRSSSVEKRSLRAIEITNVSLDQETLRVWEFSGHNVFYATHQFFLVPDSVILVCFSLSDPESLLSMQHWIETIQTKIENADVIIVGTHRDRCANADAVLASIRQRYARAKNLKLHGVFGVHTAVVSSLEQLRAAILSVASHGAFTSMKRVRQSFFHVKALVSSLPKPTMSIKEFHELCDACFVLPRERDAVLSFLRRTSDALWYDKVPALADTIVRDSQWLVAVMAIVTEIPDGKFGDKDVPQLWHVHSYPDSGVILKLLEAFDVIYKMRHVSLETSDVAFEYVVPCVLPEEEPTGYVSQIVSLVRENDANTLFRIYRFKFLPASFMSQLCVRLLSLTTLHGAIWRTGVCSLLEDDNGKRHCLLARLEPRGHSSDVLLQVISSDPAGKMMHLLVTATESLLRGWYPSAQYTRHIHTAAGGEVSVDEFLATLMDIKSKESFFRLSGTIKQYESVAPDLLLRRTKRIRQEEFTESVPIGSGGFGSVCLACYENEKVVVKELKDLMQDSKDTFGAFQNECYMMTLLQHPKIIQLIGICLHPTPSLVIEYCMYGDLRNLLAKFATAQKTLPWSVRLKILHDIAEAMSFSHRLVPPVVHRDLKSPNVFLSRSSDGFLMAKVADLGLATVLSQKESAVENPIWLAPEALLGMTFDEKIDVYSFGIIMYEVLCGSFPFEQRLEELGFMTALGSEIVKGLRPGPYAKQAESAPNGFVSLMEQCWAGQPKERPSFRQCLWELGAMVSASFDSAKGVSLSDLGPLECDTVSPILSFGMGKNVVLAVHESGCISRFDLASGNSCRFGKIQAPSLAQFEGQIGLLTDEAALIGSRGKLRCVTTEDSIELPSIVLRVAFVVPIPAVGCIAVVGYTENALTNAVCEVRKLAGPNVDLVGTLPVFSAGQKLLSCCVAGDSCLWILFSESALHKIVSINLKTMAVSPIKIPAERYPHHVANVGSRMIWGLSPEAILVWNSDGTYLQAFDPVKAAAPKSLGICSVACAAGPGCALVASTQGLSLWDVASKRVIAFLGSGSYSAVSFAASHLQGVVLGSKLRKVAIVQETVCQEVEKVLQVAECAADSSESVASAEDGSVEVDPDVAALTLPSLHLPSIVKVKKQSQRVSVEAISSEELEIEVQHSRASLSRLLTILKKSDSSASFTVAEEVDEEELQITLPDVIEGTNSGLSSSQILDESSTREDDQDSLVMKSLSVARLAQLVKDSNEDDRDESDSSDEVVFLADEPVVERFSSSSPPPPVVPAFRALPAVLRSSVSSSKVSGYLNLRATKGLKQFKKRFFELSGADIRYWKSAAKERALGIIHLAEIIEINCVGEAPDKEGFCLIGTTQMYEFAATASEVHFWIEGILAARAIPVFVEPGVASWGDPYFSQFATRSPRPKGQDRTSKSPISTSPQRSPRSPRPTNTPTRDALTKVTSFLFKSNSQSKLDETRK